MGKLYYGNGDCSIEGNDIRGIQIKYKGRIAIIDKTSDSFVTVHKNNGIMIFPIGEGTLNKLFTYEGTIRIYSVISADNNGERVITSIHKMMDYAELLGTSESLTRNSEEMGSGYNVKTLFDVEPPAEQRIIPNLHTSRHNGDLYLSDGTLYLGDYHVHLESSQAMTGVEHTKDSRELYIKSVINNKLVSTYRKGRK